MFVIEIWNLQIFCLTTKLMSWKFVILGLQKYSIENKRMSLIFVPDTTEHPSFYLNIHFTELRSMCGLQVAF